MDEELNALVAVRRAFELCVHVATERKEEERAPATKALLICADTCMLGDGYKKTFFRFFIFLGVPFLLSAPPPKKNNYF